MVRTPEKTCPNLSRLFDETGGLLLASFLESRAFEKLSWLSGYRPDSGDDDKFNSATEMLRHEKKDRLGPLETEAARIVTISTDRGQFALEGRCRVSCA